MKTPSILWPRRSKNNNSVNILVGACSNDENYGYCDLAAITYDKEIIKHFLKLMDRLTEVQKEFPNVYKFSCENSYEVVFISNEQANDDKALEDLEELQKELDSQASSQDYIEIDGDCIDSYINAARYINVDVYRDKIRYKGAPKNVDIEYITNSISKDTLKKLYKMLDPNSIRFIESL